MTQTRTILFFLLRTAALFVAFELSTSGLSRWAEIAIIMLTHFIWAVTSYMEGKCEVK